MATLLIGVRDFLDMYPRTEKMTKPAKKLVTQLMELVASASLYSARNRSLVAATTIYGGAGKVEHVYMYVNICPIVILSANITEICFSQPLVSSIFSVYLNPASCTDKPYEQQNYRKYKCSAFCDTLYFLTPITG